MSFMFSYDTSLTNVDLSGFNTSSVENMRYMFYNCESLNDLDLSSFDTEHVTDMTSMFNFCKSLTALDLSSFNTSSVENMDGMLWGCSHLQTIYAGEEWSTDALTDSRGMFYGCVSLVGGQGTRYNEYYVDASRAHIDGGPDNPGYFTEKVDVLQGDVNADGEVSIADVNCVQDIILESPDTHDGPADVNGDHEVNIADMNAIINIILSH